MGGTVGTRTLAAQGGESEVTTAPLTMDGRPRMCLCVSVCGRVGGGQSRGHVQRRHEAPPVGGTGLYRRPQDRLPRFGPRAQCRTSDPPPPRLTPTWLIRCCRLFASAHMCVCVSLRVCLCVCVHRRADYGNGPIHTTRRVEFDSAFEKGPCHHHDHPRTPTTRTSQHSPSPNHRHTVRETEKVDMLEHKNLCVFVCAAERNSLTYRLTELSARVCVCVCVCVCVWTRLHAWARRG
jgi:hypothetical protein